jgi:hypothetical protein
MAHLVVVGMSVLGQLAMPHADEGTKCAALHALAASVGMIKDQLHYRHVTTGATASGQLGSGQSAMSNVAKEFKLAM